MSRFKRICFKITARPARGLIRFLLSIACQLDNVYGCGEIMRTETEEGCLFVQATIDKLEQNKRDLDKFMAETHYQMDELLAELEIVRSQLSSGQKAS